jgi:hypothetical protein
MHSQQTVMHPYQLKRQIMLSLLWNMPTAIKDIFVVLYQNSAVIPLTEGGLLN